MNHPDHLGVLSDRADIARHDCKLWNTYCPIQTTFARHVSNTTVRSAAAAAVVPTAVVPTAVVPTGAAAPVAEPPSSSFPVRAAIVGKLTNLNWLHCHVCSAVPQVQQGFLGWGLTRREGTASRPTLPIQEAWPGLPSRSSWCLTDRGGLGFAVRGGAMLAVRDENAARASRAGGPTPRRLVAGKVRGEGGGRRSRREPRICGRTTLAQPRFAIKPRGPSGAAVCEPQERRGSHRAEDGPLLFRGTA